MAESLQPVRPQCSRRFFHILAKVRQYGFDGTHDERQADEDEGYDHAQWRESDLQTEGLYDPAHPAARSVKNSERNAGHGGWQSEGKVRSEEHTSELQSLMRISYAVFCLKKK